MIKEIVGDLFLTSQRTILCPCNAAGAMGAGVAKTVRDNYPDIHHLYLREFPKAEVGTLDRTLARKLITVKLTQGKRVLLFCTKYHWKENSAIDLIDANLTQLRVMWRRLEIQSLSMPRIGCGKGKLDYERDVRPLLMHHFGDTEHDVEVVSQ